MTFPNHAPFPSQELDDALASHELFSHPMLMTQIFADLRNHDPVHWTAPKGFEPFWAITKHADVVEIGRHGKTFLGGKKSFLRSKDEEALAKAETGGTGHYMRNILNMDGEDHKKYRGLMQSFFLPSNLKRLEDLVQSKAQALVQKMVDMDGECDFCNDVAVWYPLQIIMALLGVPESDHPRLLQLTQQYLAPQDPTLRRSAAVGGDKRAVFEEHYGYFKELFYQRRAHPQDDLASLIAASQIDGQPIPELEGVSYYMILANAGHDTTSSSMGTGLHCLIKHPEEMVRLKERPDLLPGAIEEMFRFATPAKHFVRTAVEDFELRGRAIKSGQELALFYPSANFDEEAFEDPQSFRVDRSGTRQIAFGFGPHICLGQNLARMTMRTFFSELLRRIDKIQLMGEPEFITSNQVAGLKRLPIRYSIASAAVL